MQGFASLSLAILLALYSAGLLTVTAPLLLGYTPPPLQPCPVQCPWESPALPSGQPVKIMNWNIQFLAGRYYPYWNEPDREPPLKEEDLNNNLQRIVNVIREVDPDILQLQEVHLSHPVSFQKNQLKMLLNHLSDRLPCHTYGSYWKARMIPKRMMMGEIDMAMVTMSRYQMGEAFLRLLPSTRTRRIVIPFNPRHSLMETRFPLEQGSSLTVLNTHLDAPSLKPGNMALQTEAVLSRLNQLTRMNRLWVMSGDFNRVPPGFYQHLPDNQKPYYQEESLLAPFYKKFHAIPRLEDIHGPDNSKWLTAYDQNHEALDLILDYIFTPKYIEAINPKVLHIPLDLSDHMPVVTEFVIPAGRKTKLQSRQN